ncbi:MAG: YdcF family protein [Hyphomicrobiaceae bacterium]|nr:YdcF family protein [Hyphomicrobiaceae bacterium]
MRFDGRSWSTVPIGRTDAKLRHAEGLLLAPLAFLAATLEAKLVVTFASVLENRIARPSLPDGARLDGIIILGGSATRVHAAVGLSDRFPDAAIVLSGPGDNEIAVAKEAMRDARRAAVDRRATTTYENALYSKDLVAPRDAECWAVVTSAVHMPRAIGAFHAVDFPVVPWPVDDTPGTVEDLSAWVWHEVLGLIGYWALGRSAELFPAPPTACLSGQQ